MTAAQANRGRGRPSEFNWHDGATLAGVLSLLGTERALEEWSPHARTTVRRWKRQEPAFAVLLKAARDSFDAVRIRRGMADPPNLQPFIDRFWVTIHGVYELVERGAPNEAIAQWVREYRKHAKYE